ncbi:hypothetical protein ENBRE01_3429, partial [Enteropsectra breve]
MPNKSIFNNEKTSSSAYTISQKQLIVQRSKQLPKLSHAELVAWGYEQFGKHTTRSTITKWISSKKYENTF